MTERPSKRPPHYIDPKGTEADADARELTNDDQPPNIDTANAQAQRSTESSEQTLDLQGVNPDTFPTDLVENGARWLLWQYSDDRKVPRNPAWGYTNHGVGYAFVGAKDPEAWFDFEAAARWINHDDDLGFAYYLTSPDRDDWDNDGKYNHVDPDEDVPDEPHVGLLDFDDIRDPDTGAVAPAAADLLERLSGTFCEWSPSGTGAHALGGFRLPDSVKTLTIDLSSPEWPDAELEIYPGRRYTTVTGDHIPGTATETNDIHGILEDIIAAHPGALDAARATNPSGRPDELDREPETSKAELADIETTSDIQDVFDAIQHTGPRDIRLRSTVTHERGDGSTDLDPSWAQSKSGTRLAQVGDGWVYRKGMQGLDALQVVALEERIITTETEYPSGEEFWDAVDALRNRGAHIPKYEPDTSEPVSALPLAKLDSLSDGERERAAAARDIEWPSTAEARKRLRNRVLDAVRNQEEVVIDAPTGLGKSYTVATEPWLTHADITDKQPIIHFSPTRDSRDAAAEHSREADGVTHAVLRGRKERCPVAHGIHDPTKDDEDSDVAEITMNRTPASEWFDAVCDGRGVPFSTAHSYLAEHNDQDLELPCCRGEDPCPAVGQWEGLPRDEDGVPAVDVIHATHQFAYVPGLTQSCNVIFDERPDFGIGGEHLTNDRIQRAVAAFLQEAGAPVSTWESFVQLARQTYGRNVHGDALREANATIAKFDYEPAREWYLEHSGAHTLAPALVRAVWSALAQGFDENGRGVGTVTHNPPRLDTNARDDDSWSRTWVTVVVDDDNRVQTIRSVPDFSGARSMVGLDAHPSLPLWQRNTTTDVLPERVLDVEERRLWRRYERGLRVVQVGDAVRPLASGEYFNPNTTRVLLNHLSHHFGDAFNTCITAASVEHDVTQLMREAGIRKPETMHFGEERSRDDFGHRTVGLVHGSIDPGDDYVLNILAECDLHAQPETTETEDGDERRAHGRGFVGPDADIADEILASVRENHIAQSAGRYARNADDPDNHATVFVHTSAIPAGFADHQVPGVQWVATDAQRSIMKALRDRQSATARELAEETDVSKRHVAKTLARLLDEDLVRCHEGVGAHGADVFHADGEPTDGVVELTPEEITNKGVWSSSTWSFAVSEVEPPQVAPAKPGDPAPTYRTVSLAAFQDGPPPE
ncbi:Rrf2 family transcriptional regulator [Halorussus halophilus]|uniref:Rrf2 family transcriptional regulator n=1 Tax=Halorussus halophilus TaxID=2650975 RepID=UPI001300DF42|nr:Rrf2 family transcriptional regulator [Halorussus halophilus]